MASTKSIVDFLLDQLSDAGEVSARKMFGDYGLFMSGKMIGLICDDQLYFKPTEGARPLFMDLKQGIPFPGAKPWFLVPEEDWEDRGWLSEVAAATAMELPLPRPKKKRAKRPA